MQIGTVFKNSRRKEGKQRQDRRRQYHADLIQEKQSVFLEMLEIVEIWEIQMQKCEHYVYCLKGSMQG